MFKGALRSHRTCVKTRMLVVLPSGPLIRAKGDDKNILRTWSLSTSLRFPSRVVFDSDVPSSWKVINPNARMLEQKLETGNTRLSSDLRTVERRFYLYFNFDSCEGAAGPRLLPVTEGVWPRCGWMATDSERDKLPQRVALRCERRNARGI